MLEWIVSSCVLIIFIMGIRKVFRRKLDAGVLYALWLLVAVRLLVPFSFAESSISVQNLIQEDTVTEQMTQTDDEMGEPGNANTAVIGNVNVPETEDFSGSFLGEKQAEGVIDAGNLAGGREQLHGFIAGGDSTETEVNGTDAFEVETPETERWDSSRFRDTLAQAVTYIWLGGIVISMLLLTVSNWVYRRSVSSSGTIVAYENSKLPVYLSEKVSTPCMFGVFRPAIYLTESALADQKALKYIVCHENTHYKHRDNWWAIVRALCVCVHWYNPLVWLAARLSMQDCELACDAETLKSLGMEEKVDYGRVLLDFSISDRNLYSRLQLATTMSGGKEQLKERLQMIVREPKRYVWALVVVALLVGVGIGMTFTGRAATVGGGELQETEKTEATNESENTVAPVVTEMPQGTATPAITEVPLTTEAPGATEEVRQSLWGYDAYTGYMDECYKYYSYEQFANQDYDEDGLPDRIWRENIEDGALGSYRIDFGNGDVLLAEKIGGGMPYVKTGDLDGDGQNEILVGAAYGYSTDPDAYGEWAVYKKNGPVYEVVKLPGYLADYEGDGNGGVLPSYQAILPLKIEDLGNHQVRIYCVDTEVPGPYNPKTDGEPLLDVTVSFDEETWIADGIGGSIQIGNIGVNRKYTYGNIYSAEIVEESFPVLRTYASMFGKWCMDEIVTTFVLKDGEFQVYDMEYVQTDSVYQDVDLGDGKNYQLRVNRSYLVGDKTQKVNFIWLYEVANDVEAFVCEVNLDEASVREWGEEQAIWGNEGYAIIVEDFNFDGCEDLAVQGWIGAKNIPYYCFLWNPVSRQYEYSALIPNVEVDKENQLVVSYTNDGGGQYSTTYYKYDGKNQLHMVRYVQENLSPEAALPKLDLTYYADDAYGLQAVDCYNERTASYEGVRVGELTYYAKKALEELYEYSGYRVEQAHFIVYESGTVAFGQTQEDMKKNRHFYSRSFNDLGPLAADIASMHLVTERDVWYSSVIQWNVPEKMGEMTDEEVVRWFFEQAPIAGGEGISYMEENFEDNFLIETESGKWYEVSYNSQKRLISSIYGPYPEYPTH